MSSTVHRKRSLWHHLNTMLCVQYLQTKKRERITVSKGNKNEKAWLYGCRETSEPLKKEEEFFRTKWGSTFQAKGRTMEKALKWERALHFQEPQNSPEHKLLREEKRDGRQRPDHRGSYMQCGGGCAFLKAIVIAGFWKRKWYEIICPLGKSFWQEVWGLIWGI